MNDEKCELKEVWAHELMRGDMIRICDSSLAWYVNADRRHTINVGTRLFLTNSPNIHPEGNSFSYAVDVIGEYGLIELRLSKFEPIELVRRIKTK